MRKLKLMALAGVVVSIIPAPVVPTEAALAEHRELMGRLSEE